MTDKERDEIGKAYEEMGKINIAISEEYMNSYTEQKHLPKW